MRFRFSAAKIRRTMSPRSAVILAGVLIFLSFAVPGRLHAQNPNGALRGEVQDASAARVAGARVVVQSHGASFTREATANERGNFASRGCCPDRIESR